MYIPHRKEIGICCRRLAKRTQHRLLEKQIKIGKTWTSHLILTELCPQRDSLDSSAITYLFEFISQTEELEREGFESHSEPFSKSATNSAPSASIGTPKKVKTPAIATPDPIFTKAEAVESDLFWLPPPGVLFARRLGFAVALPIGAAVKDSVSIYAPKA
jgi:hypothetical protein